MFFVYENGNSGPVVDGVVVVDALLKAAAYMAAMQLQEDRLPGGIWHVVAPSQARPLARLELAIKS